MPTRHFYAIHRPYGLDAVNSDGLRANEVHRFATLAAAARWVAEAPEQRELIPATTPAARKARRYAAEGWGWPQKVMD